MTKTDDLALYTSAERAKGSAGLQTHTDVNAGWKLGYSCLKCNAPCEYREVGDDDHKVRCPACGHGWYADGPDA